MQLPSAGVPQPPPMPARYNSYFSSTPTSSRPIQINNAPISQQSYHLNVPRVIGLDFVPSHPAEPQDSIYVMDFMDIEESNPASTSSGGSTVVIEENKENGIKRINQILPENNSRILGNYGNYGNRNYKRPCPVIEDPMVHEETESETGLSGDEDDCLSNCGCVHSAHSLEPSGGSINGLGFRSFADIIGYAKVVRAERSEALAELRAAVEKFNDMRQRKSQLRASQQAPLP